MKKTTSLILTITILILLSLNCFAINASPSYNSLNVYLTPNKDGSVDITEEWDITYFDLAETKTFQRTFEKKSQNTDVTNLENYTDITNISAIIDETVITENNNSATSKITTEATENGNKIIITANSDDNNLKLILNYKVSGAIKLEKNSARLCFRIIDSQTGTINNVQFNINSDGITSTENISPNNVNIESVTENNTFIMKSDIIKEIFDIDISMPADEFDKNQLVKYSAFSDKFKNGIKNVLSFLPFIVIVAILLIISYYSLFNKKIVKKNIEKANKTVDENVIGNVTLSEGIKLITDNSPLNYKKTKKYISGIFTLGIADLIRLNYIQNNNEQIILNINEFKNLPVHLQCIAELLMKYSAVMNEIPVINNESFTKLFKDIDTYSDYFFNLFSSYYSLIKNYTAKELKNNPEIYSTFKTLTDDCSDSSNISQVISMMLKDTNTDIRFILPVYKPDENKFNKIEEISTVNEFSNNISLLSKKINMLFE